MGLKCKTEKVLSSLLAPHYHQQSNGSNAEEDVGGGLGDNGELPCGHINPKIALGNR